MNSKSSSIRRWLVLGSLVTFAFALCVVGARTQTAQTYTVTITPGNPPTVSPDTVTISKSDGDQVEWVCPQCTSDFAVQFLNSKSPFAAGKFDKAHPKSGKAVGPQGTYPYKVTANGHTNDPTVIVH